MAGDGPSFEKVYRFYYPRLNYFARQYVPDHEVSKNIVQDVFTELWDKREIFRSDTNLSAWLFTVTKNKSLKMIGQMKSRQNYDNYLKARQLPLTQRFIPILIPAICVFGELQAQIQKIGKTSSFLSHHPSKKAALRIKKNREIAEELQLSIKL
jgi:RNA polymerase sigma-70 factor (ECF subfamily)